MKIIITESKLEDTILKFLDNNNFVVYKGGRSFNSYIYFLEDGDDNQAMISVYHRNAFGEIRNWVYVNPKLINRVTLFVPIDEKDFLNIVSHWVSNVLNMKINSVENAFRTDQGHRLDVRL
jgi:hypothetical protein